MTSSTAPPLTPPAALRERVPASVRPFVSKLFRLDKDVRAALSPWLPRLSLLLGPLRRRIEHGGDPDGYAGLSRRGPYQRLLLSEWALAAEIPDEFLRRAAMGEHLFLDLERNMPSGGFKSVVLVDTGPDQLGGPRAAHLAAAIVGAVRAERHGATFAWGALAVGQPVRMFHDIDVASVRNFLDARRASRIGVGELERWRTVLARFADASAHNKARPDIEVLFVGGRDLQRTLAQCPIEHARLLLVEEQSKSDGKSAAGRRQLLFTLSDVSGHNRAAPRGLSVDLPDEKTCIRLLRDPFEKAQAGPSRVVARVHVDAGIAIPLGARRVLVRTDDSLLALVEPNSPRHPPGPPKRLPLHPADRVVAAGLIGKTPCAVVLREGRVLPDFLFMGVRTSLLPPKTLELQHSELIRPLFRLNAVPPVKDDKPTIPIPRLSDARALCFVDDAGNCVAISPRTREMLPLKDSFLLPPVSSGSLRLRVTLRSDGAVMVGNRALESSTGTALLGALPQGGRPGCIAVHQRDALWSLVSLDSAGNATPEQIDVGDRRVVGACMSPTHGPCVVAVEEDRRLVLLHLLAGTERVRFAFAARVVAVAPNLERTQLAVLLADGSAWVVFLQSGQRALLISRSAETAAGVDAKRARADDAAPDLDDDTQPHTLSMVFAEPPKGWDE